MVFSSGLEFWAEISWAFLCTCYVVVGPLACKQESECVVKEIFIELVGGGAPVNEKRGRTTLVKTRIFDCTMGFPGEDVAK